MTLFALLALTEALQPGVTTASDISQHSINSFSLRYSGGMNSLEIVVETLSAAVVVSAQLCASSVETFAECSRDASRRLIEANERVRVGQIEPGDFTLFVRNLGADGAVFVTFEDSVLLSSGGVFSAEEPAILRLPVCSDATPFAFETSNIQPECVFYAFSGGAPARPLESFGPLEPRFPGFLYLRIDCWGDGGGYTLSARQNDVLEFSPGDAVKTDIAAYRGCYRDFMFPGSGGHITAAASEVDERTIYDVMLYYRANFSGKNPARQGDSDAESSGGLLSADTAQHEVSQVAIRMQQQVDFLPHGVQVAKDYEIYFVQLYITFNGYGILPGQKAPFSIANGNASYVIPFKTTGQAIELNGDEKSSYIVQASFANIGEGTPAFEFGHENPEDNSFLVERIGNLFESVAPYMKDSDYKGDLFYATVYCDGFSCDGNVRAEHSYRLEDRQEMIFTHIAEETDQQFYMHYDLAAAGMDLWIREHKQAIKVYISQSDVLPNGLSVDTLQFECAAQETCNIVFKPGQLEDNKVVYISVDSDSNLRVLTAKHGENVMELQQGQYSASSLFLGENELQEFDYLFNFNRKDYSGRDITKKYTVLSFEAENVNKEKLPSDLEISIYASYLVSPGPDNYFEKTVLSAGEFVMDANGLNITRMELRVLNNYGGKLYMSVRCEGAGCADDSEVKSIRFRLTPYTVDEITSEKALARQMQSIPLQNGTDVNYFMLTSDYMAELGVFAPSDPICSGITYKVYVCVGVVPTTATLKTIGDTAFCKQRNLTVEEEVKLDFDTTNEKVAAGMMYAALVPDFSKFEGDLSKISRCTANYVLYNSELIEDFHIPVHGELFEAGAASGLFYAARVPTIATNAATVDNPIGDYLAVKVAADEPIEICISDAVDGFYPLPLHRNCINQQIEYQNDAFALLFKNYRNQIAVGKISPHTIIYISVYADVHIQESSPLRINLTIAPQTKVAVGEEGPPIRFICKEFYGLERYVSYAFDLSNFSKKELSQLSLFTGPFCNDSYCRNEELHDEFYTKGVITSFSEDDILPLGRDVIQSIYNKGVELVHVSDYIAELKPGMLYVTLEYRWAQLLNNSNHKSGVPYYAEMLANESVSVEYQRTVQGSGNIIAFYHATIAYIPTEVVLYPCRGRPAIIWDEISPNSRPDYKDYRAMLVETWGEPISFEFMNDSLAQTEQFFSIFDLNSFDIVENKFTTNESSMSYELFVGSEAREYRPGNHGEITVAKYSSNGNGQVKVRFAPAAAPNQEKLVAPVNYTLYALPYAGSFDEQSDYSPYTSCGVGQIGYPIYKNGDIELIDYDPDTVARNGYIEVTSNLPLWPAGKGSGEVVYVTVLANRIAYQGVLAGSASISAQLAMALTFLVVIIIIVLLLTVFYFVYIRNRKQKTKGYRQVIR